MSKLRSIAAPVMLTLLLCACTKSPDNAPPQTTVPTYITEATVSTIPTEPEIPVTTEPIQPPHSELYLPDYTPQQITAYFEEVVLNVEYSDGTGSDHLVQKWLYPLFYRVYGTPTEEDMDALNAVFAELNAIPGFPGIYPAENEIPENVSIHFLDPDAFGDSFSDVINGEEAFGAAQFWYYTATNEIHTASIGCRTDIEQSTRNSVIPEEFVNVLGLSDTTLRPDSITYQYSDDNTALSDVDLVILKLLYDPAIQCGMSAEECAAIIQQLYY